MWYDRNDKSADSANGSVALGALWVRLIGCFWAGAFAGMYLGVSPWWEQRPDSFGRFAFSFWWSLPPGLVGGFVYFFARSYFDAKRAAAIAAAEPAPVAEEASATPEAGVPADNTFAGLLFGRSTGELYSGALQKTEKIVR